MLLRSELGALAKLYASVDPDRPLRAVVQGWNERSLRLARGLGFRDAGTHQCVQDGKPVTYVLLVRPAEAGRP